MKFKALPRDPCCGDTQRLALARLDEWMTILEKELGSCADEDIELHQRVHELIENFWYT